MVTRVLVSAFISLLLSACGTVGIGRGVVPVSVTTLAGTSGGPGGADGAGREARFFYPSGLVADGNILFITDTGNHTIRRLEIGTGTVTTVAGKRGNRGFADGAGGALFNFPYGIATDGENLYICDSANHIIRKIVIGSGLVSTLAGRPGETGSADGKEDAARFYSPYGIVFFKGLLYVADTLNNTIRTVEPTSGAVGTLAGVPRKTGFADGGPAEARFNQPVGIAHDGRDLFVTDSVNQTIRKVDPDTGGVTTLAGFVGKSGGADGKGRGALFNQPFGITAAGKLLYITDTWNYTVRVLDPGNGEVTTLAGLPGERGFSDGSGTRVRFSDPAGVATDGKRLFVADSANHVIRESPLVGNVFLSLAGMAAEDGIRDGYGDGARFKFPGAIATDGVELFVSDTDNHTIRRITPATGEVRTLAGDAGKGEDVPSGGDRPYAFFENSDGIARAVRFLPTGDRSGLDWRTRGASIGLEASEGSADGKGAAARFRFPGALTADGTSLYVCDTGNHTIRIVRTDTALVTTLAGSPGARGYSDGTGAQTRFDEPDGIVFFGGALYLSDTGNHVVRKIMVDTGEVTTIAGSPGVSGYTDGTGAAARFNSPSGLVCDGKILYVADTDNHVIRSIELSSDQVRTLAGRPEERGARDGSGGQSTFNSPLGLFLAGKDLYVSDRWNHVIRVVNVSNGEVGTFAGKAGLPGSDEGSGSAARFQQPFDVTGIGNDLFVCDTYNHKIRKIRK